MLQISDEIPSETVSKGGKLLHLLLMWTGLNVALNAITLQIAKLEQKTGIERKYGRDLLLDARN